jgi:hypothetical protein
MGEYLRLALGAGALSFGTSGYLPFALDRKYPNADRQWNWQYGFPSSRRSSTKSRLSFV